MRPQIKTVDQFAETFPLDYARSLAYWLSNKEIRLYSPIVRRLQTWASERGYVVGLRLCQRVLRESFGM